MPPDPAQLLLGVDPAALALWVACLALATPVVTLVHELGHAVAALRLSGDHVLIRLDGRPLRHLCLGKLHIDLALPGATGSCVFFEPPGRHAKATIAAAGPLASLAAGAICAGGWLATGWIPAGAFAAANLLVAVHNAAPTRFADRGEWHVSDGLWVARSLGLVRPPRRPAGAEPIMGRPYAVILGLVVCLVLLISPAMLLLLAPLFALGWVISAQDREEARAAEIPPAPETWDTARSVPPPGER